MVQAIESRGESLIASFVEKGIKIAGSERARAKLVSTALIPLRI